MGYRMTPRQAEERLRAYGYTPLEPYPGGTRRRWLVRCAFALCQQERHLYLGNLGQGPREGRCKHQRRGQPTAEQEARAAGYIPLEPYPGLANAVWQVQCAGCGQPRRVQLCQIRAGYTCKHQGARPGRGYELKEQA